MEERKSRQAVKVVLLLLALAVAMVWGMVVGGGLVYAWTHFFERPERQARAVAITVDEPRWQERGELSPPGAVVVTVVSGSPADRAGLQEGDRIVAVDGRQVGFAVDLAELIRRYEPGDRITLTVDRPGEDSLEVQVKLAEHPEEAGRAYLGVEYAPDLGFYAPGLRIMPFEPDGSFEFLPPGEEFEFHLDELPGEFRFYRVPGKGDTF